MSKKAGFTKTMRQGSKIGPKGKDAARGRPAGRKSGKAAARANGASTEAAASTISESKLLKRRDELSRRFTELQWDLGGMTYEMAARDHFRLDVLSKQAAKVQEVDAELGQIERMLKMEEAGAAGTCPNCNALQARGAVFCWQCGKELVEPTSAEKPKPKSRPRGTKARSAKQ